MTALPDDQRDPALSALLQANVDAPPLRPSFHDELEARLQSATAAGVTTVPARRRRARQLRLLAAASVAAVAAILVFAVLPALRGGDTATAGDVLAAMTAASGGAQTVRLTSLSTAAIAGTGADAPDNRSTEKADLTLSIAGDSLALLESASTWKDSDGVWHSVTSSHTTGYDQDRHESRAFYTAGTAQKGMTIHRPAWQSEGVGEMAETYSSLSASLRAAVAETDPSRPVEETTYLGRPAWHGVFTVRERWGIDGELPMVFRWTATVDQATGLLVAASCAIEANGEPAPVGSGPPRHQPRARPGAGAGLAAAGGVRRQDDDPSMTARASARPRKSQGCRGRRCRSSRSGRLRAPGSRTSPAPVRGPPES